MKVLMITPYLPYPLTSGGNIRTYNLLKNLSAKHEITLFSFIRREEERVGIKQLQPFCAKIKVFKRSSGPWHPRNLLLSAFSYYPLLVAIYLYAQAQKAILEELEKDEYDLIHAETFYVMPNIPRTNVPILLVEQVIEYLVYQTYVERSHNLLAKLLYFDVAKIKYWEHYFWKKAEKLATMSEDDKQFIAEATGRQDIKVVANGVDPEYFAQTKKKPPQKPTVLFVGHFKWLPNKEAISYLVEQIWPLIKKEVSDARLWIVGRDPTSKIKAYGEQPDITVDAGVEDIRDAFGGASVLLAPILNGKGTKYKVLEAMATGTPVVATPLGVEGIAARDGKEVYIGQSPKELAKQTIDLLKNKAKSAKIAAAARKLVESDYSWKAISDDLDQIYQELGRKK
jgi:glycosyltransferase involved in cell wall biosynthesis